MASVDPFIQPIPAKFQQDPELRAYFEYLHKHLFQAWVRTGGGDDAVLNQSTRELYPWDVANDRESFDIYFDNSKTLITKTVSSAYTTTGSESLLIVTGATTITLNANPKDQEAVSVKRATTAGFVTVSGQIDGASNYTMTQNYQCIDLIYSVEAGEWLIV